MRRQDFKVLYAKKDGQSMVLTVIGYYVSIADIIGAIAGCASRPLCDGVFYAYTGTQGAKSLRPVLALTSGRSDDGRSYPIRSFPIRLACR